MDSCQRRALRIVPGALVMALLLVHAIFHPSVLHAQCFAEWTPINLPGAAWHSLAYDEARSELVLSAGLTWTWDGQRWNIAATTGPSSRIGAAMVYDRARAQAVLFGGGTSLLGGFGANDETWLWDGHRWARRNVAGPPPLSYAAMAYDPQRERVVLFGGVGLSDVVSGDTWEWDGQAWLKVSDSGPDPRYQSAMAYHELDGVTVLFGGKSDQCTAYGDTWTWDGSTWRMVASQGQVARFGAPMAYDRERAQIVGFSGEAPCSCNYRWDTWVWSDAGWNVMFTDFPSRRSGHASVYDPVRRRVVIVGGSYWNCLSATDVVSDMCEWDGSAWIDCRSPTSPPDRIAPAFCYDAARDRALLFGGYHADPSCPPFEFCGWIHNDDTWELVGNDWVQRTPPVSPSKRSNAPAAYDAARGRAVVFGGHSGYAYFPFGETWEWDGNTWAMRSESGPPARSDHATAYDSTRARVVIFGGLGTQLVPLDDLWSWNGSASVWSRHTPTGAAPPARSEPAMVFDSSRDRLVLFGGLSAAGVALDDLWEYHFGSDSWTAITPTGPWPGPRYGSGFFYEEDSRRMVVVSGRASPSGPTYKDAWAWDGKEWHKITVRHFGSFLTSPLAADALRKRALSPAGVGWSLSFVIPDIDAFLAAFDAGDPAADYNGDGFVDGIDYDQFMNFVETGC